MRTKFREFIRSWHKELLVVLVGLGLTTYVPALKAQNCNSDENHYHDGADHCDSGGSGCTVVCP